MLLKRLLAGVAIAGCVAFGFGLTGCGGSGGKEVVIQDEGAKDPQMESGRQKMMQMMKQTMTPPQPPAGTPQPPAQPQPTPPPAQGQ